MVEENAVDRWLEDIDAAERVLLFPEDGRDPIAELEVMAMHRTHPTIGWIRRNTKRSA